VGGGSGNAKRKTKGRGWLREREIFEASLRAVEQQDIRRIARVMVESQQPQAQRIARKLIDYRGEIAQIESLQRELAKLEVAQRAAEAAQRLRVSRAEHESDLRAASDALAELLHNDADLIHTFTVTQEFEAHQMLAVLGLLPS
jgi:hypothetical protein